MYSHLEYWKNDLESFYKSLGTLNFKNVTAEKILELKTYAAKFNEFLNNKSITYPKSLRYVKIANTIKTNPKGYGSTNKNETALLFMFSVDPNFEAFIIFEECNKISEAKNKMRNYFNLYDANLIKLESYYIKFFLGEESKQKINEEIDRRVYK